MFIQHGEYFLNTANIQYFKVKEDEKIVLVFFGGPNQNDEGRAVILYYKLKSELDLLILKLTKW